MVVEMSATLAGVMLYQMPRGMTEGEEQQAAMQAMRDEVELLISRIIARQCELPGVTYPVASPGIVNEADE